MKKQKSAEQIIFPMPKFKKHRFLKAFALVSFFVGMSQIQIPRHYDDLPYNDSQEVPPTTSDAITAYELEQGLKAYNHLISALYDKCQNMGISLEDGYLIEVVAYDYMTDSIQVVLQKNNQSVVLTFSAEKLTDPSISLGSGTLSDQISSLTNLLDVPILDVPHQTFLSNNLTLALQNNVSATVQNTSRTATQFSSGDLRTQNDEFGLVAGRDYYYFNVYGKGTKDGKEFNVVTTVAMKADDMDILDIDDLIAYYITHPQDEHFVINLSYQESLQTLKTLNSNQPIFEFEP